MSPQLMVLDALPDGLLNCESKQLAQVLKGPTLIHLPGERPQPLFVSVLLHGNETTGYEALRLVLREYHGRLLPRAMSVFIGNVEAAALGTRVAPGGADYNRIWPDAGGCSAEGVSGPESRLAMDVMAEMRRLQPFASIDLHNTSGRNPHHACITEPSRVNLELARLFSRQVLYFTTPRGVQTMAFTGLCPAMTAECGLAGVADGVSKTADFIRACLHLEKLEISVGTADCELYQSIATVKVPRGLGFAFGDENADICLLPDLDSYNWREIPQGAELARLRGGVDVGLQVYAPDGKEVTSDFLHISDGKLLAKRPLIPAMLSLETQIIRQDCLCYFLERVS